tara:strand:+ start:60 stop:578 length:519 start_codon:yes stop_codon:yes gene_type:complete
MNTSAPSPENISEVSWRTLVLTAAPTISNKYDLIGGWELGEGANPFNQIFMSVDFSRATVQINEIYIEIFKPFIKSVNVDEVDMYVYMRDEGTHGLDSNGSDEDDDEDDEEFLKMLRRKEYIMIALLDFTLFSVLFDMKKSIKEHKHAWITLQAVWRGYNDRWKYPVFTFND